MEIVNHIPVPNNRHGLERVIERLINLLDKLEPDPDFEETGDMEPYLSAGAMNWTPGGGSIGSEVDLELDDERELETWL